MLAGEFADFERELVTLEKLYGKKLDDGLMRTYFESLRDVPLGAIKRRALEHVKRSKFFPKPAELRPKDAHDDRPQLSGDASRSVHLAMLELAKVSPKDNGNLPGDIARNARVWTAYFASDRELARTEHRIGVIARDLAAQPEGSDRYRELEREDRELRDKLYALRQSRAQSQAMSPPGESP